MYRDFGQFAMFGPDLEIWILSRCSERSSMAMNWWFPGFRSGNVQYTTRAALSAKETCGVACATLQPRSRTLWKSLFSWTLQSVSSLSGSEGLAGKLRLGARKNAGRFHTICKRQAGRLLDVAVLFFFEVIPNI